MKEHYFHQHSGGTVSCLDEEGDGRWDVLFWAYMASDFDSYCSGLNDF
jgi:hypothetical protein